MKRIYCLLSFSVLLFGCSSVTNMDDVRFVSYNDFGDIFELKGEIFELDSVWKPERIFSIDSLLILTDRTCDNIVQIFNKSNRHLVGQNLPYGIGPNEKLSCWSIQFSDNKVYTFDLQMGDLSEFDKYAFFSKRGVGYKTAISIPGATDILALNNGKYAAFHFEDDDSMLSLYDSSGKRENIQVDFPQINLGQMLTNFQKRKFYETRLYYNSKNDKVFVTYLCTDLFDIYDSNLKLLHRIYGPDHFIPNLKINSMTIGPTKDTKYSSVCSCLTDNYIWVLYNGTNDINHTDIVLVFDYQGNPIRMYHLDTPIHGIAVDEKEKAIYCIGEKPELCVMKFSYEE
ncbi:MAG: hypothetical protein J6Z01_01095 [Bacteroidales bacterium]|nr:hypothetical protein [Bacteroidales bacterium]